jgi:putative FmdB family regulatory protein
VALLYLFKLDLKDIPGGNGMPIYEYECAACGKTSEFIEGLSGGGADKICSHCGNVLLQRVLLKGVTARRDGIIGDRGGKTCCGSKEGCREPGTCCR